MGEAARSPIDTRNLSRPGADTNRPGLEAIPGGVTAPRGERTVLDAEDVSAEEVATIIALEEGAPDVTTAEEAETAPTELTRNKAHARDEVSATPDLDAENASTDLTEATRTRLADLDRIMTPPPPDSPEQAVAEMAREAVLDARIKKTAGQVLDRQAAPGKAFDAAAAANSAGDPALMDKIDIWLSSTSDNTTWPLNIMPNSGEPRREPWDEIPSMPDTDWEKPPENKELNRAVEAVNAILELGWNALRKRVNSLFEGKDGRVNDRRVFGASAVFGVVGAFAIAGLTANMVGDFQNNVRSYLESQQHLVEKLQPEGYQTGG